MTMLLKAPAGRRQCPLQQAALRGTPPHSQQAPSPHMPRMLQAHKLPLPPQTARVCCMEAQAARWAAAAAMARAGHGAAPT